MDEETGLLHKLWVGFCHLILFVAIIGFVLSLAYFGFLLMAFVFFGSLYLLGKTWCLVVWGLLTVIVLSYGLNKEFRKYRK